MEEETRQQFESALQALIQQSTDKDAAADAVNELQDALQKILEERDQEWEEYIEEHELSQTEPDKEHVAVALKRLLNNIDTILNRALHLEKRLSNIRDRIQEALAETEEEQQIRNDIRKLRGQFNDLREDISGELSQTSEPTATSAPDTPAEEVESLQHGEEPELREVNGMFPCPYCSEEAKSKAGLKSHIRHKHKSQESPAETQEQKNEAPEKQNREAAPDQSVVEERVADMTGQQPPPPPPRNDNTATTSESEESADRAENPDGETDTSLWNRLKKL